MSEYWMGSRTSDHPIIVSVYADTPEAAEAGARRISECYPVVTHGTSVVPPVLVVTGLWKANVYLIPGKNGEVSKWPLLNQSR